MRAVDKCERLTPDTIHTRASLIGLFPGTPPREPILMSSDTNMVLDW